VTQRHKADSLPVVRWTFQPAWGGDEQLVAKVNMRKAKFYGNYTKSFARPKMKLIVVKQGKIYNLLIINITSYDRGLYSCRVQEFKKHRDRWKAANNSTAATELRVNYNPDTQTYRSQGDGISLSAEERVCEEEEEEEEEEEQWSGPVRLPKLKLVFGLCFRRVPVCGADLQCGAAVHVFVHGGRELPVSAEEKTLKRKLSFGQEPSEQVSPLQLETYDLQCQSIRCNYTTYLHIPTLPVRYISSTDRTGHCSDPDVVVVLVCVHTRSTPLKNRVIQYPEKQMDYSLDLYTYRVSGETVTSVVSLSPALPKKQRRYKTKKTVERVEVPPEIPAKAPIADKVRKPKLLKPQPRKIVLPKIAEESLTYAELELVKPLPDTKTSKTGTVYAQILFEDQTV
ncbi:hypothetical protein NFI96_015957, partial [Prochilodus magdalenae]